MTDLDLETPGRARTMDRSNAKARDAVAATQQRFALWRSDLARFSARVERRFSGADQKEMLSRCTVIAGEVQRARTELIVNLMDAPRRVVGNSRVVDVEKALDNIDATLGTLRRKLSA